MEPFDNGGEPPATNQPSAGDSDDQAPEGRPEPTPSPTPPPANQPVITPGTYSGTISCRYRETQSGFLLDRTDSSLITPTFGPSGLPIVDGQEVARGQRSDVEIGVFRFSYTTTQITESENGINLQGEARWLWDCGDTCIYARDGICDEVRFCALGTDCADCGPVVLTGVASTTYQVIDDRQIRRIESVNVSEQDAGIATINFECDGVLSR
jgi:hypothetical protein